jgi:hypothetical protein
MRRSALLPLHTAIGLAIVCLSGTHACAHGSDAERGLVMLLPTGYYLAGGAFAVIASFALIAVVPFQELEQTVALRRTLFRAPQWARLVSSLIAVMFWGALLFAGIAGSRDPLVNPLPTMFWTVWWVGFTLLHALFGNLWASFNPWYAPLRLLGWLSRGRIGRAAILPLPRRLGYFPSILIFGAFAWFELISLAPSDPTRLAEIVGLYWLFVLTAKIVFGEKTWAAAAEPFSIYFSLIAGLAPLKLEAVSAERPERRRLCIVWPGSSLIARNGMPTSGTLFILLTLASVSFDGLSRTFLWLDRIGINPLEFPGRSAVTLQNTAGLLGTYVVLSTAFFGSVFIGCLFAGRPSSTIAAAGRLIYSIIPISLGFHAAHYLSSLLLDGQFAIVALSDPFARGWDLLHVGSFQPTASFFQNIDDVTLIWNVQALIICSAHVIGIIMAHYIAIDLFSTPARARSSQYALAALMVFYTVFGLWLLSTPTGT